LQKRRIFVFHKTFSTMTVLEKATAFLPKMSNSEIAQLVQMATQKIAVDFPGIEKTPNVCGGSACVIRTRIPVWSIVEYMLMGIGKEKLLRNFPTLRAQDLAHIWAYYDANKAEIDAEIAENNAD
jgi:uncharacterized protein (DUF433 family)